jgi:hypothetical protein
VSKRHYLYRGPDQLVPPDALARRLALEAEVQERPNDASTWIALSQACQTVVDEQGMINAARRAVDLAPDDINAIRQFAYSLIQVGPSMADAQPWFERLYAIAPDDPTALHYCYSFALFDRDCGRALQLCERLDRLYHGNAQNSARVARALRLQGDDAGAAEHFARAAAQCTNEQDPFPLSQLASLKPVYTALAGDPQAADLLSLELCQDEGRGLADLSHPRYPDNSAVAIAGLQSRVHGRDLFVFGNGPSLNETVARQTEFASIEFFSLTMSSFQHVNEDLLRPIGKQVDAICMTHPSMMRSQISALRHWRGAVPQGILLLPLWLRELAAIEGGPDFLLGETRQVFWYDCYDERPPSPQEPLHIPAINTLLPAMFVGLLARPRRIFLFGFDGKIKGTDSQQPDALYYKEHDASYHMTGRAKPAVRELTRSWLWRDTMLFNDIAPHVLRHGALLFDLPQPPIYNVCADSALDVFPRITFKRFRKLVSD